MPDDLDALRKSLASLPNGELKTDLLALVGAASIDLHAECNAAIRAAWRHGLKAPLYKQLCGILNPRLAQHEREMTTHGVHRSFRFWSDEEKRNYLLLAVDLIHQIRREVTENVCLAYGTALAVARSDDLIPHDDDVDVLVVLPKAKYATFAHACQIVFQCVRGGALNVTQADANLLHVRKSRGVKLDIFVGLEEEGMVASFPGPRNIIEMKEVFLPIEKRIFGVDVPVPRDQHAYLSKVYGQDWRTPNPFFSHNWKKDDYLELF